MKAAVNADLMRTLSREACGGKTIADFGLQNAD
jgi:hypothetical protein